MMKLWDGMETPSLKSLAIQFVALATDSTWPDSNYPWLISLLKKNCHLIELDITQLNMPAAG